MLLKEFADKFANWDGDDDGILSFQEAKNLVVSFFKEKIKRGLVEEEVVDRIGKKIDPFKKNRVLFSELVEIIDKI